MLQGVFVERFKTIQERFKHVQVLFLDGKLNLRLCETVRNPPMKISTIKWIDLLRQFTY